MSDPYKIIGVPNTATDAEIKKAYRDLARKYHPDHYHDNPLADLAQEKMKEINEAYELIQQQRKNGGTSGSYQSSYQGSYQNAYQNPYQQGGTIYQQIRFAIGRGDLATAERLLNAETNRTAEWYYLHGNICYRRGWMDEAKRAFQTACTMEPNHAEYRQALQMMQNRGYRPGGFTMSTMNCGDDTCTKYCWSLLCCNMMLGGSGCFFCV